jgi:hypothetical protein
VLKTTPHAVQLLSAIKTGSVQQSLALVSFNGIMQDQDGHNAVVVLLFARCWVFLPLCCTFHSLRLPSFLTTHNSEPRFYNTATVVRFLSSKRSARIVRAHTLPLSLSSTITMNRFEEIDQHAMIK